jgi:hypothetical protein
MRRVRGWLPAPLATVFLLLVTVAPAQAHTGLVLTVNDDGRGSVSVDVAWADGHPVSEPMAGTLTAVSARGTQVGPAALTRLPDRPTVVYDGTLKPGTWQVTVDLAVPGIGHCAAEVQVAATARPGSTRCADTPPPAAAAAGAEPASGGGVSWPLLGVAAVIVLATSAAVVVGRRRVTSR